MSLDPLAIPQDKPTSHGCEREGWQISVGKVKVETDSVPVDLCPLFRSDSLCQRSRPSWPSDGSVQHHKSASTNVGHHDDDIGQHVQLLVPCVLPAEVRRDGVSAGTNFLVKLQWKDRNG